LLAEGAIIDIASYTDIIGAIINGIARETVFTHIIVNANITIRHITEEWSTAIISQCIVWHTAVAYIYSMAAKTIYDRA